MKTIIPRFDSKLHRKLVISAPMSGYTDGVYRRFARRFGADITFTEMVSAEGLVTNPRKAIDFLHFEHDETPIAVQVFTSSPNFMATAAKHLSDMGFCVLDINMGCPVRKVIRRGAGSALLKNPQSAKEIVAAAMEADMPVSVKIRSAFKSPREWESILKMLYEFESMGISFVTIHPRSAADMFGGKADWSLLSEAVAALSIPVFGSGDINTVDDIRRIIDTTDVAGVMLARGAIANFQLFTRAKELVSGNGITNESFHARVGTMLEFIAEEVKIRGEEHAIRWCRKFMARLIRNFAGARQMRQKIYGLTKLDEMNAFLSTIVDACKSFE